MAASSAPPPLEFEAAAATGPSTAARLPLLRRAAVASAATAVMPAWIALPAAGTTAEASPGCVAVPAPSPPPPLGDTADLPTVPSHVAARTVFCALRQRPL
eukprot:TRINITY_DN19399_c0_g1_i1.p2 TRINITY_DN19399_c0_g1~~TRINITY_DN19399_c0_g1_i1.p2  ORF type:complete len:101 (+),score=6.75 TRINITY_DN19399_c0_g1_i1:3-305(+)